LMPKFVGKWLKKTSATGSMIQAKEPRIRVQDFPTMPLLCRECETRFSKLETYFADEFFLPFHEKGVRSFEYDERLKSFVVSLSWRTLKLGFDDLQKEEPQLAKHAEKAENLWRSFLLGTIDRVDPYENHMLFLDYVKDGGEISPNFQWYTLRAVDATLAGNDKRLFAYTKLPWMIFATSIWPTSLDGWHDTLVSDKGKISPPQEIEDGTIGRFLVDRSLIALGNSPRSEWSRTRLLRALTRDPERFLESASFETMIAERDRVRRSKMKDMPKSVKGLVEEIIINAVDEPGRSRAENRLARLQSRRLADLISNLSRGDVLALDKAILSAIREAKASDNDAQRTIKSGIIWVTFMVNPHSSIQQQRSGLEQEIARLKAERGVVKIPLVVFSMRPHRDGVSFETGFWID